MEGIGRAIEAAAVAGKLRAAAREYRRTAAALDRAAVRYSAGVGQALESSGEAEADLPHMPGDGGAHGSATEHGS